jgi:hypothetical protein
VQMHAAALEQVAIAAFTDSDKRRGACGFVLAGIGVSRVKSAGRDTWKSRVRAA